MPSTRAEGAHSASSSVSTLSQRGEPVREGVRPLHSTPQPPGAWSALKGPRGQQGKISNDLGFPLLSVKGGPVFAKPEGNRR